MCRILGSEVLVGYCWLRTRGDDEDDRGVMRIEERNGCRYRCGWSSTGISVPVVFIMGTFLLAHELLVDDFFELDHGGGGLKKRSNVGREC